MNAPTYTHNSAELELLAAAAKEGITAFPLGAIPNAMLQMAHERLVRAEHLRLIDIAMVMNGHTRKAEPARVFKITPEGRKRLMELRVTPP